MGDTLASRFLALMSGLYEAAERSTHELYGHAPPATITWQPPAPVAWTPGGFVLTANELNATTDRGALAINYTPPLGTTLSVGDHVLTAELATDEFEAPAATVRLTVNKARATINWPPPAAVDWAPGGLVLTAQQLNAVTDHEALAIVYDPPLGTALMAGTHNLKAKLDSPDYEAEVVTVTLAVNKMKVSIYWAPLGAVAWIPGGFLLSEKELNAGADKGSPTIVYDPPLGSLLSVGDRVLTAKLVSDTYEADAVTHTLTITKARTTIRWSMPAPVEWVPGGFKLSENELNAATDEGSPLKVYDPPLGSSLPVGDRVLVATLASTEYEADAATVTLTVKKARTAITWSPPAPVTWVPGGFKLSEQELSAKTDQGSLEIAFDPPPGTPLPVGDHVLTAMHSSGNYQADPVTVTLTVARARATIVWAKPEAVDWAEWVLAGHVPGSRQLNAKTNPPDLKISYSPDTSGGLPAGTHQITASISDAEPYVATPVTVELVVREDPAVVKKRLEGLVRKAELALWRDSINLDIRARDDRDKVQTIITKVPFQADQELEANRLIGELEVYINTIFAGQKAFTDDVKVELGDIGTELLNVTMNSARTPLADRLVVLQSQYEDIAFAEPSKFLLKPIHTFRDNVRTLATDIQDRIVYETDNIVKGLIFEGDYANLAGDPGINLILGNGGGRTSPNSPVLLHLHVGGIATDNLIYEDSGASPVKLLGRIGFHINKEAMKNKGKKTTVDTGEARAAGGPFATVFVDRTTREIQRN